MLIRIVKLTFKEENIPSFEALFEETKKRIINFEGCHLLELYQDMEHPATFFTYSHWENQAALEAYRNSSFFKSVWARTKKLFREKPMAWSVEKKVTLS